MPVYEVLAPGVYIEEVPITPSISGVGTSTSAFIGVSDGANMPFLPDGVTRYTLVAAEEWFAVTSFEQFTRQFGKIDPGNLILALSVRGYFNNGGTVCYVTRVDSLTNGAAIDNVLAKLEAIDQVSIVAAPGALDATIQDKLITHCAMMMDRFAILDGQRVTTVSKAAILGALTTASDYAAVYFPWVEVSDPSAPGGNGKAFIPPSGLMAGVYARVDATRGVHKAPANEPIRGALGLEYLTTKNEQSQVNLDGINVIRSFNGNIKVWGARTRIDSTDNVSIRYINVRRLMLFLFESIDEGTQWVVFEPNNYPLWQKITRSVNAFLTRVWRDGALFGAVPEEAFYVKCDRETNPDENIAVGIVTTEIGVAPVRPAEFVVFRISQFVSIPTP